MKRILWILMASLLIALNVYAESSPGFAVVELFTSEGCSSCPPADKILMDLKARADQDHLPVYVLGFHVDYWNNLGWPDVFSAPEYSARQRQYAKKLHASGVYTPQVIINGRESFGGYESAHLQDVVQKSLAQSVSTVIKLEIKKDKGQYLVFYRLFGFDPKDLLQVAVVEDHLQSDVARGENAGEILKHTNVVRLFYSSEIQDASGQMVIPVDPEWKEKDLTIIVFLQNRDDFHIVAVDAVKL